MLVPRAAASIPRRDLGRHAPAPALVVPRADAARNRDCPIRISGTIGRRCGNRPDNETAGQQNWSGRQCFSSISRPFNKLPPIHHDRWRRGSRAEDWIVNRVRTPRSFGLRPVPSVGAGPRRAAEIGPRTGRSTSTKGPRAAPKSQVGDLDVFCSREPG